MELNNPWIAGLAGLLCGVISGFGIGGGSLLMVWMTAAAAMDQKIAQGINLLYFLPTSIGALVFHIKNKMVCFPAFAFRMMASCSGRLKDRSLPAFTSSRISTISTRGKA